MNIIQFTSEYENGQFPVYLRTDPHQEPYMVTGIIKYADGSIGYRLTCKYHNDFYMGIEISVEKNVLATLNS